MAAGSDDYQALIEVARSASEHSLAPLSRFRVGVALLCDDGTVVSGCNIEGSPTSMSTCAERTTMVKALSSGFRSFKAVAVVAAAGKLCWPCGGCRQTLYQFAPDIDVVVEAEHGGMLVYKIAELLPQYRA